jgi:hypothetical protein
VTARDPRIPTPSPQGASGTPRRLWSAVLAIAIVVLAAVALRYSRPVATRPRAPSPRVVPPLASPPAPFQPEVESQNYQVAEASGRVEVLRGSTWKLVNTGDVLTKDDLIRTGIGRALMKLAGGTEIEIRDRVELRLDSISRAGASVDLRRGKLTASTQRGHSIAIKAAHTQTVNESDKPARIIVTADGQGRVAVAATQGSARFEAAGQTVVVPAGKETRAEPGAPPLNPETIAEDVLLTVTWPAGERHEERLAVQGTAKPGSLVRVNGAPAAVDKTGHFTATVPLRDGPNAVDVEAEDAVGRLKHERREVHKVATTDPDLVPVPKELWPP